MSLVVAGLACLVLAVVPLDTGSGGQPTPVEPDTGVALPAPGSFGRSLVLYGATGGARPDPGELGCVVTGPSGAPVPTAVDTLAALGAGERTVSGVTLTPLATVRSSTRSSLRCSGPIARSAQPLYLLGERRRPVPRLLVASFGVAALGLGAAALAVLRVHRRAGRRLSSS